MACCPVERIVPEIVAVCPAPDELRRTVGGCSHNKARAASSAVGAAGVRCETRRAADRAAGRGDDRKVMPIDGLITGQIIGLDRAAKNHITGCGNLVVLSDVVEQLNFDDARSTVR